MKKNLPTEQTALPKKPALQIFFFLIFFCPLLISMPHAAQAQAGEWTWMSGSSSINGTESYGTQGVPSVTNHPSGLYEACEWTDTSGMFWLYGGGSSSSYLANLWKYNPATNEWTWVKGPGNFGTLPVYGTQGVPAPGNTPGSRAYGVSTFTGKDGNLWLFGGLNGGSYNDLWKYDIASNEWTWMKGPNVTDDPGSYGTQGIPSINNVPPSRSECAASWVDTSGNLWVFGGWYPGASFNDLWKYDPLTNEWTWMKGSSTMGAADVYGTKNVSNATNTPGGRNIYTKWNDGNNNLYLFGGDAFALGVLHNDVWKYSIATNEWVWVSGTNLPNLASNATATCVSDSLIYPAGKREGRACWVDPCKKFWLFGGSSQGSFYGSQNDLWKFDPLTHEWTWVSGSQTPIQSGNFGTQGVSAPTNQPPAHSGNLSWVDNSGNFWIFGGTDQNWPSAWNDLWRYVPDTLCSGSCNVTNPTQIDFSASNTAVCEKFCVNFFDNSLNNPTGWQWSFPGASPSSSTDQNPVSICYNNPGTYDVTLITFSASGTDTLTNSNFIVVNPTPAIPTITQTGYTLTSSTAASYQWQLNNVDIPGATNQSYNVTQTGYYTVFITDQNGCIASATTYVLITGIETILSDENISIYPNPSNGNFIVEYSNGISGDELEINIHNTLGQLIFSSKEKINSDNGKIEIDLCDGNALPCVSVNGIYFIEIKTGIDFARKKIMIVK